MEEFMEIRVCVLSNKPQDKKTFTIFLIYKLKNKNGSFLSN